jgi:3-oxoacyl-[acyl-carrier-protein] synthase-3
VSLPATAAEQLSAALVTAPAGIAGLGTALPQTVVDTPAIADRVGVDPAWILKRTGIARRRHLAADERLTDLAAVAGRAALSDAGIEPPDVDAVIVATSTADELMPHAAPLVAHALGASNAMAWDVGLACTGFLAALEQGAALVNSARASTVLVIAADALSRITDHSDRKTAGLFADGAGAVVLAAGAPLRVGPSLLRADGGDSDALFVAHDERMIRMDGPAVFQRAVACMEQACRQVLAAAGLTVADVDLVVPHQANARITAALRERLDLEPSQVVDVIVGHGNTGAATIPLALADAADEGRIPATGNLLLTAFGAGFAYGASLLESREPDRAVNHRRSAQRIPESRS